MPGPQWSSEQKVAVTKPIKREPLLTADDVAQLLNVKPTTVYEWARMDYIPHIPRRGRIRSVMSNSFGFGGHNTSLVFRAFEE